MRPENGWFGTMLGVGPLGPIDATCRGLCPDHRWCRPHLWDQDRRLCAMLGIGRPGSVNSACRLFHPNLRGLATRLRNQDGWLGAMLGLGRARRVYSTHGRFHPTLSRRQPHLRSQDRRLGAMLGIERPRPGYATCRLLHPSLRGGVSHMRPENGWFGAVLGMERRWSIDAHRGISVMQPGPRAITSAALVAIRLSCFACRNEASLQMNEGADLLGCCACEMCMLCISACRCVDGCCITEYDEDGCC